MHHQRGRLRRPRRQRHHRERPVGHHQLRRHPVHHPHPLVPAERRRQLGQPVRQVQHRPLHHHPVAHPAPGRLLLRVVLHAGHDHRVAGHQRAHLLGRAELELEEALGDRRGAGHHLHQVVHRRFGRRRPVLLREQRRRQLRLLQLVPLLGEQRAQRHPGRSRHPAVRPRGGLRRETLPLQPAQRPLGVVLGQRQAPRQIGDVGRAHGHQRPVRRLVRLVQPYRRQHRPASLPCAQTIGSGTTWRKPATAQTRRRHHRRTSGDSAKVGSDVAGRSSRGGWGRPAATNRLSYGSSPTHSTRRSTVAMRRIFLMPRFPTAHAVDN